MRACVCVCLHGLEKNGLVDWLFYLLCISKHLGWFVKVEENKNEMMGFFFSLFGISGIVGYNYIIVTM